MAKKSGDLKAFTVERYCRLRGYPPPVPEHRFHPVRRWRFDLAWVPLLVALEFQGGGFVQGRHTRGPGHRADCEKFTEAALLGWRVMLVTTDHVKNGSVFVWLDRLFAGAP